MAVMYHDSDADLSLLMDKTIAVLGYGNMGRAMALNLRDSAFPVLIGNQQDHYAEQAYRDGFEVTSIPNAISRADVILVLLPDELLAQLYVQQISPGLQPGNVLVVASGYNITFGFIEPPAFVDVVMIAPQAIGKRVRESYVLGSGFPSFVAVEQDASGAAWARVLAVAKALGALRRGALEITFQQETALDLFNQQALLPALHSALQTALEVLYQEGFPPEAIMLSQYLSGELGYIIAQWAEQGMIASLDQHNRTAQYGTLSRTERFKEVKLRRQMESVLDSIRSGAFAQEWAADYADGYPRLRALRQRLEQHPIWQHEQTTLAQMRDDDSTES
jgi:ketol-acid reductoisomerase